MKKKLFFLFLIPSLLFSSRVKWPIKDVTDGMITSVFAENRGESFHQGVDILVKQSPVFPIENGELFFYWDSSDSLYPQECGLGKFIVVQHPKYRSYYSHLKKITLFGHNLLTQEKQIGVTGKTGRASQEHLHLDIKDEEKFFNPLEFLPPLKDNAPPVIRSFIFQSGYYLRQLHPSHTQKVFLTLKDSYQLVFLAHDLSSSGKRRGIYRYQLKIESIQKKQRVFYEDVAFSHIKQGKLIDKYLAQNLFLSIWGESFIFAGEWKEKNRREEYLLELKVFDFAGNFDTFKRIIAFR